MSEAVVGLVPRQSPKNRALPQAFWPKTFELCPGSLFVNVGGRTNVTGLRAFARMILEGRFEDALSVACEQVEDGAQLIDVNMGEGMLDAKAAMVRFLNLIALKPDIARMPILIDLSKFQVGGGSRRA